MTVSLILTHILGLMSAVIIVVVIVLSVTVTRHMKKTESLERELQSKVIVGTPERSEKNLWGNVCVETDKQVTADRQGRRPLLVQQGPNTQVLQAMLAQKSP